VTRSNVIGWRWCSGRCEFKTHGSRRVIAGLDPAIPIKEALQIQSRCAGQPAYENNMARQQRHPPRDPAGDSQRQLRVGELIRHELADMLSRGDIHDPVIEGHLITVPEVRVSPDLRLATIYVMPLGGRDIEKVIEALDRNKRFVRGEIARRVNLKFAPEIRFRVDERFDEAERIEKLLRTPAVQRDLDGDKDE
jgi:ribosome-binding factor A